MRKEAEQYAEEDRRKYELAQTRNEADYLAYTVEKALKDLGDKVPGEKRRRIEEAIKSLRDKLDSNADATALRQAMDELKRVSGEIMAEVYRQTAQEAPSGSAPGGEEGGGGYVDYKKE